MAVGHPRKQVADLLQAEFPKWKVVAEQRTFDPPGVTALIVKQNAITRLPAAPLGARNVEFTLTLVSRFTAEMDRIEDDLDARLSELLDVLDKFGGLKWTSASKVAVTEQHLGYDITVEVVTTKE